MPMEKQLLPMIVLLIILGQLIPLVRLGLDLEPRLGPRLRFRAGVSRRGSPVFLWTSWRRGITGGDRHLKTEIDAVGVWSQLERTNPVRVCQVPTPYSYSGPYKHFERNPVKAESDKTSLSLDLDHLCSKYAVGTESRFGGRRPYCATQRDPLGSVVCRKRFT